MGVVVGQVGEERLVDVEDPGVPAVAGDLDAGGEGEGVGGDHVRVGGVAVAGAVALHRPEAPLGDGAPGAGVVRLHREPPALAEQLVVPPPPAAAGDHAEDRGSGGGGGGDGEEGEGQEEEAAGEGGRHGSSARKLARVFL